MRIINLLTKSQLQNLKESTKFLDIKYDNVSDKQRGWHIIMNDYHLQYCICGNLKKWNKSHGYVSCSIKCRSEATRVTVENKYGTTNVMKVESIKNKVVDTFIRKYNNRSYLGSEAMVEELGYKNPMQNDEIKKRREENILLNHGVSHTSKIENVKQKLRNIAIDRNMNLHFGENPMRKSEIIDKIKITNIINRNVYDEFEIFEIKSGGIWKIRHKKCNSEFECYSNTFKNRLNHNIEPCDNCNPRNNKWSSLEIKIKKFLESINVNFNENNRKILNGQELDFYLPDFNLGIEINGLYWHSYLYKHKSYHQDKYKRCKELGISLLQIYEDDINHKFDIVKSIIKSRLNLNNKIYARKLEIRKVELATEMDFINKYHLQGYVGSTICLGLFNNNELIQIMSFKRTKNKDYELLRLCTKSDVSVIGGSERLFKYFTNITEFNRIASYNNLDYFDGKIYEKMVMKFLGLTVPSYFYFNTHDAVKLNRQKFQKHKLVKSGFDNTKSESQIAIELGYIKIYTSGNSIYEIKSPELYF